MSEHAPPLAKRIGLIATAMVILLQILITETIDWITVLAAASVGIIIWSLAYVIAYVGEQWMYETGRLTRPPWMEEEQHPVDEMKDLVNSTLENHGGPSTMRVENHGSPSTIPGRGVTYAVEHTPLEKAKYAPDGGGDMVILLTKLAQCVLWENMDKISRRQLESYGVVADRTSAEAGRVIAYLQKRELLRDIGNSQYAVTEQLKYHLEQVTGVSNDKYIRASQS